MGIVSVYLFVISYVWLDFYTLFQKINYGSGGKVVKYKILHSIKNVTKSGVYGCFLNWSLPDLCIFIKHEMFSDDDLMVYW